MNRKMFSNFRKINFVHNHSSSFHSKFLIIGGGTGGLSVAGQLYDEGLVRDKKDITIVDNASHHYYQPGFTKVAGGIYSPSSVSLYQYNMHNITSEYILFPHKALQVIPENNKVTTEAGDLTYDTLILSAGLEVNLGGITGLEELLEDEHSNVTTIYKWPYPLKTLRLKQQFKGGISHFTQPPAPIKCAGAPQKIVYLCDSYWKQNNIKSDVHFHTPLGAIFGIPYYSDALEKIADEKKIIRHYKSVLTSFKDSHTAIFKETETGKLVDYKFDFLHVTPPMRAPELLRNSPSINDAFGFVDVDATLRHKKYQNIYAIGDCNNLPNAKTAAAIFSQAPVLVANLKSNSSKYKYEGYSACPLFIGDRKLMLAEFKIYKDENGNTVTKPDETFIKNGQTKPSFHFYLLTYSLGYLYHFALKGKWFGKCAIINPINYRGAYEIGFIIIGLIGVGYFISKKRDNGRI